MSLNIVNNMSASLSGYMKDIKNTNSISCFAEKVQKAKQTKNSTQSAEKKESAVNEYKRKHPNDTYTVDRQVNTGKTVLSKNSADKVSREDMTMEEYKSFITNLMNCIAFHPTQQNNTEIWSISEKGWEQMKNDPDYETWVLGYTSLNRSVNIPFGLSGAGCFCTENFGASIEEHIGQSVPQGGFNKTFKSSDKEEESWWEKRHKLYKEMLKKQIENAVKKRLENQICVQKQYYANALAKKDGLTIIEPLVNKNHIF